MFCRLFGRIAQLSAGASCRRLMIRSAPASSATTTARLIRKQPQARRAQIAAALADRTVPERTTRYWRSSPFSSMRSKAHAVAMSPIVDSLKAGDAVVAAGDSLAVDDAGACAKPGTPAPPQHKTGNAQQCSRQNGLMRNTTASCCRMTSTRLALA